MASGVSVPAWDITLLWGNVTVLQVEKAIGRSSDFSCCHGQSAQELPGTAGGIGRTWGTLPCCCSFVLLRAGQEHYEDWQLTLCSSCCVHCFEGCMSGLCMEGEAEGADTQPGPSAFLPLSCFW